MAVNLSSSTAEMLGSLKKVKEKLEKTDQGETQGIDAKLVHSLVNPKLLRHKDVGIKALTACCLADILRIYAPNAPYSHKELLVSFYNFFMIFKLIL